MRIPKAFTSILFLAFSVLLCFPITGWALDDKDRNITRDRLEQDVPEHLVRLNLEAKQLMDDRKYDDAIARLKTIVKVKNDYYLAQYNLGVAYALNGSQPANPQPKEREKALIALNRAVDIAKSKNIQDSAVYSSRGWLYYMDAALSEKDSPREQTYKLERAIEDFQTALSLNEDDALALNSIGAIFELEGKYQDALAMYKKSASLSNVEGKQNYTRLLRVAGQGY